MDLKQANCVPLPQNSAAGLAFLREAARTFRTTGAVAPSSRRLAERLAAPLAPTCRPRRPAAVLEVGAGTGPVTRVLAGAVGPADRLDVVEINPRFVEILDGALRTDPALSAAADRIRLIPESITDLRIDHGYDVIVSCLPFTNFDPEEVRAILDRYLSVLVPGGHLTFFAYLGTHATRSLLSGRRETARHREVTCLLHDFTRRHSGRASVVWRNLPPARVWHLRAPRPAARICGFAEKSDIAAGGGRPDQVYLPAPDRMRD
ncbi:class I SAM-dependent methyltransferase [Streptomyces griseocarneus]|uniref:class I SAM-dependent methyltransferase n=1 Tax=Streptomyces griseocarneus TaxID=51201 RepID=UPI00167DE0AA|nr:methyltransferase domain-containing protein [Streptomyces griseocarneus]MBZ6477480.1 methyltransferase domain-containing protein [Streptomyces griseocarneus]